MKFKILKLFTSLLFFPTEPRMNIFVRSEGCSDPGRTGCGRAFITVNRQGYSLHSRGVNVVVFSAEGNELY